MFLSFERRIIGGCFGKDWTVYTDEAAEKRGICWARCDGSFCCTSVVVY